MSRKKPTTSPGKEDNSKIVIVVAVIGLLGTIVTAVFGYIASIKPPEIIISATKTAEARPTKSISSATLPPTQQSPTLQPKIWINEVSDVVELLTETSDGILIYNWTVTVKIEATSNFLVQFEIWAYGPDENGNDVQYLVNSGVYESDVDQISLATFSVRTIPYTTSWRVNDIVHIERLAVRAVSIDDGSILSERDFMRNPQ